MLNTNIKTHYILIKEWKYNEIKKIAVTSAQYELYREELEIKPFNALMTIHDIDTNEILYEWRANKIEWFEKIKKDIWLTQAVFICSFWVKHPLSMWWNCNCSKEFNTLWISFKDKLKEMWYEINYDSDITEEMRLAYKKQEWKQYK